MKEIQIFNHEQFGQIRTMTDEKGETFFVGKDVATALGYSNTTKAIRDHVDKEDKLGERIVLSGQRRNVIIINESGLYALILSSQLQQAKAFKRWVTSEVLPQIRRTGRYELSSRELRALAASAEYAEEVLRSESCYTMTQVAKEMSMSVFDLTRQLLQQGIIYWQSGQYMLYSDYARCGFARTRTDSKRGRDGRIYTTLRLVWTEPGRAFLHEISKY